ncbi:hypothetical protein pb186bvf_014146 [Paramecium bursaria]
MSFNLIQFPSEEYLNVQQDDLLSCSISQIPYDIRKNSWSEQEEFGYADHVAPICFPDTSFLTLQPKTQSDLLNQTHRRIIQKGCQCSKTECQNQYCSCFKNSKSCDSLCKCKGCKNDGPQDGKKSFSTIDIKSCNCKKSCTKRYCECKNKGLYCSKSCKCLDCKNQLIAISPTNPQVPKIKKRIKKYSQRYKGKFRRTNKKKLQLLKDI